MLDCDVVKAQLQDFFDNEISNIDKKEITKHFRRCKSCYEHAYLLYSTLTLLKNLPGSYPNNIGKDGIGQSNIWPDKEYWELATKNVLRKIPKKKGAPYCRSCTSI
ncbi:MAG: hypothetical protein B6244_08835 [Candidatus Cloacimonetes bacterium 4572_55]|nr:MAG: hypothetical protein B6244_08835 [Candidatus Cloacimonetes bacterium 4572_55]